VEIKTVITLTSSEIGNLWTTYVGESATVCQLKYALKIIQDEQIRPILQFAFDNAQKRVQGVTEFFRQENHPIPVGFTDADVDLNAPRLLSDSYLLAYAQNAAEINMNTYVMALTHTTRKDIREFFTECINTSHELFNRATDLMLSLGIYVRPPHIPLPKIVDFVEKTSYMSGFFGDKRPLNATEIDQLFFNIQRNALGHALVLAYSQTAKSQKVRNYMRDGADIAKKHMDISSDILLREDIPAPMAWASLVESSTVPPFSDKLMMFQVTLMNQAGYGFYARAYAASARSDLAADYFRLMAETSKYALEGARITIDNAWLEEPPQAPDRRTLAKQK
jgi:hypothetical protein